MSVPPNTDTDLWVSWSEYNQLIEQLSLKVYESKYQFDTIVCLARGGVRVGDVMSRIFDVPLGIQLLVAIERQPVRFKVNWILQSSLLLLVVV